MSGYSGTPLLKKLGIKEAMKLKLVHVPDNYLHWLDKDISVQLASKGDVPDFVHLFVRSKKLYRQEMKKMQPLIKANTALVIWVSWYKKSAGIPTDITETDIRNHALQNGLVDIKVCAVSEQWSGLKLVVPVAKR
jgi:hypothetical protein